MDLREAVLAAAGRPEVRQAVGRLYDEVQAQIDLPRPVCAVSGRCCRFEEFGHRLYVTTLELAAFVADLGESGGPGSPAGSAGGCPFQVGRVCGVHAIRPFGCRIFFCDAGSTDWQREQYALFHGRLKRLHDELAAPYLYVEWRQAMKELAAE